MNLAFFIHFLIDISNNWRKIITDSLCVILNNKLKNQNSIDSQRESMDIVYGSKYLGTVISWLIFFFFYEYF